VRNTLENIIGRGQRLTSAHTTILLIAAGVFLVGFTITSLFARSVSVQNQQNYDAQLLQKTTSIRSQLDQQLSGYNQLLYAASTQFALRPDLTRSDWHNFYEIMNVKDTYQPILRIGYVKYLKADEVDSFQQQIKDEGFSDFAVKSKGDKANDKAVVTYLEPFDASSKDAFGLDVYADTTRRDAMISARDSGIPVMARPVTLVRDADKPAQNGNGSLLFMAIYEKGSGGAVPQTVEERRARLMGYVYISFRPADIMTHILRDSPRVADNVNITLTSVSSSTGQNLFEANYSGSPQKNQKVESRDISAYGQTWRLSIAGQDQVINQFYGPLGIFFLGAGVSVFIALVVYSVLAYRLTRVEREYEADIENTKSELLALASHQLRTPATGVKQYLGILRDGIMGDLPPMHQELVEKAFNTNERQLHVINDLLYVSKVETGQLMVDPVMMNATEVINEVISNLSSKAKEKNITVTYRNTRPHTITADDRYVRMIIENIISNAIKYSYPDSTVTVSSKLDPTSFVVKVTDKGVGISEEDVERIFEKFDRIDNPLSRQEGGSGLGLFLANQLAKGHGGSITVEQNKTKGSTFVVTLPRVAMIDNDIVNIADSSRRGRR
jgi:signal transduction histidine kinase